MTLQMTARMSRVNGEQVHIKKGQPWQTAVLDQGQSCPTGLLTVAHTIKFGSGNNHYRLIPSTGDFNLFSANTLPNSQAGEMPASQIVYTAPESLPDTISPHKALGFFTWSQYNFVTQLYFNSKIFLKLKDSFKPKKKQVIHWRPSRHRKAGKTEISSHLESVFRFFPKNTVTMYLKREFTLPGEFSHALGCRKSHLKVTA